MNEDVQFYMRSKGFAYDPTTGGYTIEWWHATEKEDGSALK